MNRSYDPFQAKKKLADRMTKKTGDEYFVIRDRDLGRYEVASQHDMDTYYLGTNLADVMYSTIDGFPAESV